MTADVLSQAVIQSPSRTAAKPSSGASSGACASALRIAARAIPPNSRREPYDDIGVVVYVYMSPAGALCAMAYKRTARKPAFHLRFGSEDSLASYVRQWVENLQVRERERQARVAEQRDATHTLSVGSIVVSSWGYEQTNVDFLEVVRVVSAKTVAVRAIAAVLTEDDVPGGAMSGYKVPVPGGFLAEAPERICRARGNRVSGAGPCGHDASLWNGKPSRCTWYG